MIVLEHIAFEGFLGYRDRFKINLCDRGLVLIIGENKGAGGADSNGVGKTTIFDAVAWVNFGETVTGEKTEEVIHKGAKRAIVEEQFFDDVSGLRYRVERKRLKKASKLTLHQIDSDGNEVDITGANVAETQAKISELLGLDSLAFRTCVLFGQGESKRFASAATTDAERKKIFRSVMRLEDCERARAVAAARKRELDDKIEKLRRRIQTAKDQMDEVRDDLDEAKTKDKDYAKEVERRVREKKDELDTLYADTEALDGVPKMIEDVDLKLAEVRKRADGLLDVEEQLEQKREDLAEAKTAHTVAQSEARTASKAKVTANAKLARLTEAQEEGLCDRCGSTLDEDNDGFQRELAEAESEFTTAGKDLTKAQTTAEQCETEVDELDTAVDELEVETTGFGDPVTDHERLEGERRSLVEKQSQAEKLRIQIKAKREQIKEERKRPNPHADEIEKLKGRKADALRRIGRLGAEGKVVGEELELATFWAQGFGARGVQSFAIDHVVPQLTEASQEYLTVLSGGDLGIEFDTTSVLKTGEVRDKFAINTMVEDTEGMKVSGGQKTRVSLAASFGLSDFVAEREGASLDCYFLDEVFDALDQTGKDKLIDLLRLLRTRRSTILAVSHDPDVARHFDRVIKVVREDGVSRIVEGAS